MTKIIEKKTQLYRICNEIAELLEQFWKVDCEVVDEGNSYNFAEAYVNVDEIILILENKMSYSQYLDYQDGIIEGKKQNLINYIKYGWIK